jgi:hypothetical protein
MNAIDQMTRFREASRERYPLDTNGNRHCDEHNVTLAEDDWGCATCEARNAERHKLETARRQRLDRVNLWWNCTGPVDDLGGLPNWPWARFDNREWTGRCDRRLLEAIHAWDLRSPLTVLTKTGGGKTSAIVARLELERARLSTAAETGAFQVPPRFLYATGYDLAEAAKRRRLGSDEHALIRAAQTRELAILDEVHASHTPADVLFSVLDMRERNGLPTVIASGMRSEEFGAAFGAHQLRRAIQGGKVVDLFAKGTK